MQRNQMQCMKIQEIEDNLYREDRMMCAVNCETGYSMVNDVLAGRRNRETQLGKKIMAELERLAKINIQSKKQKQAV